MQPKFGKCRWDCPLVSYHTHDQLENELERLAKDHPRHARIFRLHLSSRKGSSLVGLRISKDLPPEDEGRGQSNHRNRGPRQFGPNAFEARPRVKLVGNMHGNEPVGRELLIHFARFLLEGDHDKRTKRLMESTDLYILPTMNPDGFARGSMGKCSGGSYAAGRLNEGGQDLNRDFPDFSDFDAQERDPDYDIFDGRQQETKALMRWILDGHFVLSSNFHDGAVLVNYPWDNYHGDPFRTGVYETPDHEEFYHIATTYSFAHKTMNDTLRACPTWGYFKDGVTNGADWYSVFGGMQDFNYLFANTMEVTVEVSCCKYPHRSKLLLEWEQNKDSLFEYVAQAQRGIKGRVTDAEGLPVQGAKIRVAKEIRRNRNGRVKINWRESVVTSDHLGYYWRILVPGKYNVQAFVDRQILDKNSGLYVRKEVAVSQVHSVVVRDAEEPSIKNFLLEPLLNVQVLPSTTTPTTGTSPPPPSRPTPGKGGSDRRRNRRRKVVSVVKDFAFT